MVHGASSAASSIATATRPATRRDAQRTEERRERRTTATGCGGGGDGGAGEGDYSSSYFVVAACPHPRPAVAASATTRRCRLSPSPLLSSVHWSSRRVAGLVAVVIKEQSRGGFSRRFSSALRGPCIRVPVASERMFALPIPGVPPSHCPTLIVVLVNLRGRRRATTGRPRTRRHVLRRRRTAAAQTARLD